MTAVRHQLICSSPGTWKHREHTTMNHTNFSRADQSHLNAMRRGRNASQSACLDYLGRIAGTVSEADRLNLVDLASIRWANILGIEEDAVQETYDIEIHDPEHAYIGQGLLEHNSCADMLKWAMLQLTPWQNRYGAKLTCQVHDELVFRVPNETAEEFANVASGVMTSIEKQFNLIVPIEADPGIGDNWNQAK
jgi:hypothetical protein